jgi:transposase-like protein
MTPAPPDRRCPKCDSANYLFRARKTVEGPNGTTETETKYRCQQCSKTWTERTPALPAPRGGMNAA